MTELQQAYRRGFISACKEAGADPVKVAQTVGDLYMHGAGTGTNEYNMGGDYAVAGGAGGAAAGGLAGAIHGLATRRRGGSPLLSALLMALALGTAGTVGGGLVGSARGAKKDMLDVIPNQ